MPADICIKPSQNRGNHLSVGLQEFQALSLGGLILLFTVSEVIIAIRSTKAKLTLGGEKSHFWIYFKHLLETVNAVGLHPSALSCSELG